MVDNSFDVWRAPAEQTAPDTRTLHVFVVYTGPQTLFGEAYTGRLNRAIKEALTVPRPLFLLVGDGNGGKDIKALREYAISQGVSPNRIALVSNQGRTNTLGDSQVAAQAVCELLAMYDVEIEVHLVTCWYHMPRAHAILTDLVRAIGFKGPVHQVKSWWPTRIPLGLLSLRGERRGLREYLAGKPNVPSGWLANVGKPKPGVKPVI